MPDVGDTAVLTLTVSPYDGTTSATVSVTSPAGVVSAPTATTADGGATWTADLPLTSAGAWQAVWTVTGQGSGVQPDTVYAFALPAPGDAYATLSELAAWLGTEPPDNAARLLVAASKRIDTVLVGVYYATDDAGLPTDTTVAHALRDAVCAQVEWWDEIGDTTGQDVAAEWLAVGIGKVQLSRTGRGGSTAAKRVAPAVCEILQVARLLPVSPYMVG